MASSGSAYPFSPRSNAHLEPGQFWGIRLSDGGYACGVVIFPRPVDRGHGSRSIFCGGLLDWWGPEPPTAAAIGGAGFLHISNTFVDSIRRDDGMILGRRPLPPDVPAHPVMVRGLGDSFSQLAELRWGPKAMELPHLLRRVGPGHLDDIQEPSPSPLGHLAVALPLADAELAQVGDWLAHHPHFSASAFGRSRRVVDVEFLQAFRSVSDVGVTCDHVEDWSGLTCAVTSTS